MYRFIKLQKKQKLAERTRGEETKLVVLCYLDLCRFWWSIDRTKDVVFTREKMPLYEQNDYWKRTRRYSSIFRIKLALINDQHHKKRRSKAWMSLLLNLIYWIPNVFVSSMARSNFVKRISHDVYEGKSKRLKQVWARGNASDVPQRSIQNRRGPFEPRRAEKPS